ncbi:helix-turn-helix domain-containing protein [Aquibacillus kalidii]|uniref:helix-turn-helix domain-containing protein n=1 Tax=Aquibacillus kalidii TaxID=2762597 RepID=UPI001647C11E|nr:helix-turn-helix domain-containing protein [Aquibacillus kalidii]
MVKKERRKATTIKISYKPFEKTLIDKDKKKVDLKNDLGISPSTLQKMKHGEYIALDVIVLLCEYLDCDSISDIVEIVPVDDKEIIIEQ